MYTKVGKKLHMTSARKKKRDRLRFIIGDDKVAVYV